MKDWRFRGALAVAVVPLLALTLSFGCRKKAPAGGPATRSPGPFYVIPPTLRPAPTLRPGQPTPSPTLPF